MVPKLRRIICILTLAVSFGFVACDSKAKRPKIEAVEMGVGGKTFAVPIEHLDSLSPSGRASPFSGTTGGTEFLARFSAAWLSAHIDGYQPVLNNGFYGDTVYIVVGKQAKKDHARLHPVSMDLWYKRGTYENRVILDIKEPNTGFYIIQPIPYQSRPYYDREQWFLAETLPDESKPYPENPRWRPYICSRTNGILQNSKVLTKCSIHGKSADDIFFYISLASENLQVREAVFSVLASEINSWIIDEDANNDR